MRKIKKTMSFVLSNRLPPDIVQHISDMTAATRVQAFARGMLARIRRMPACRFGFEVAQFDEGAYCYSMINCEALMTRCFGYSSEYFTFDSAPPSCLTKLT